MFFWVETKGAVGDGQAKTGRRLSCLSANRNIVDGEREDESTMYMYACMHLH